MQGIVAEPMEHRLQALAILYYTNFIRSDHRKLGTQFQQCRISALTLTTKIRNTPLILIFSLKVLSEYLATLPRSLLIPEKQSDSNKC